MNVVKSKFEVTKAENKNIKIHFKQLLQEAKNKVICLSKELHDIKKKCDDLVYEKENSKTILLSINVQCFFFFF